MKRGTEHAAAGITGIILAGGKSSRMGANKALLPLGGSTCIGQVTSRLRSACAEVVVVSDGSEDYAFLSLPVVGDRIRESGPLAGIFTALSAITTRKALVLSCDIPFVSVALLRGLAALCGDEDALLPVNEEGRVEPLCGVYDASCLPAIKRSLEEGQRSVMGFLEGRRVKTVLAGSILGPGEESGLLKQMNTPEEYRRLASGPARP